jgi:hypothetical protein
MEHLVEDTDSIISKTTLKALTTVKSYSPQREE